MVNAAGMPQATSASLGSPTALLRELHRIRGEGFAMSDTERHSQVRGVAVPIGGQTLALGVAGRSDQLAGTGWPAPSGNCAGPPLCWPGNCAADPTGPRSGCRCGGPQQAGCSDASAELTTRPHRSRRPCSTTPSGSNAGGHGSPRSGSACRTGPGTIPTAPSTSRMPPAATRCPAGTCRPMSPPSRPTGRTAPCTPPCRPTARPSGGSTTPPVTSSAPGARSRSAPGPAPDAAQLALPTVAAGYPAGLEVGRSVVLAGFSDDDGTRIHLAAGGAEPRSSTSTSRTAASARCPTDETIWVLSHSEHGDSRYPALRAFSLPTGDVIGELSDAPGKGLAAVTFSPVPGDQRLLVGHERRGRDELLIWDLATGAVTELLIDLPGDLDADFYPDGTALLVVHTHAGRTTVHRYDLATGELTDLPVDTGVVSGASARPDGSVWYRWSSAAAPGQLRVLRPDGTDDVLLRPAGEPAPGSEPVSDIWVDGPGGRIHALVAFRPTRSRRCTIQPGWPTVFAVHGGPAAGDEDSFDASRAAWLDAGFAVVQVNYRGSTGYGSAWRDALTERIGHTELADIAAVHDHLVADGVVDPAGSVIAGYSWGGYLALLALGVQPERWVAGVAGVPVADYVAAYEDEMEPLRAYDRALFGGSPQEVPDAYRDSSPMTYVDRVRVAGAGAGRRERPALPDPADRQLPRRAGRAGCPLRAVPVRRRPRVDGGGRAAASAGLRDRFRP